MNAVAPARMTVEEFLALPDDGVERMLIDGRLVEMGTTLRDRWHAGVVSRVAKFLANWLDSQPAPRGQVQTGDAGFCLPDGSDTVVGIDVAYVSADVLAQQTDESSIVQGIPVLAVEVLSPSDTIENINLKMKKYRRSRVPLVWLIDTDDRTVKVCRLGEKPKLVDDTMDLSGEPELPGFTVAVARLFE